jgi:iron complex transport system permease protein
LIVARSGILFAGLVAIAVVALLLALASGSADISLSETVDALFGTAPESTRSLIIDLRLPRALTAFSVGGLLAVAGVLMQVLLRNPLAEPYILGTSGGAAVAALLAMIFGLGSLIVDLAAFGGAMAATLLVFSIAHGTGSWTPARLLLTGVVLAAGFSAATTLLLALSPDQNLRGMLFWLMGDLPDTSTSCHAANFRQQLSACPYPVFATSYSRQHHSRRPCPSRRWASSVSLALSCRTSCASCPVAIIVSSCPRLRWRAAACW